MMAGLEILTLLEEPVAAAYAYAIEKEQDQTILVYDLGGGTFDVSILRVDSRGSDKKEFQVLAKQGVQALGGDDFDFLIMKMAAERFRTSSDFDVFDDQKDQGASPRKVRAAQQKLRDAAVMAKHELSELKSTRLSIPNLLHDREGTAYHLDDFLIPRQQFDNAILELIEATRDSVEEALRQAGLKSEQVDRVLLVGGSTKIPLVREMLRDIVGQEPFADTDPDTAVARGAAILGATLPVPEREARKPKAMVPAFAIDKQDIVTHHLGIEIAGGRFNCLIPKGTVIPRDKPVSATRAYTTLLDGATELVIRVFQTAQEAEFVSAESVRCTGEFTLRGIPARPGGEEQIQVMFEVDSQNLLRVSATCAGSIGKLEISAAGFTRR
jgi:molecular chaperone DnaK (HSP70)